METVSPKKALLLSMSSFTPVVDVISAPVPHFTVAVVYTLPEAMVMASDSPTGELRTPCDGGAIY